MGSEREFERGRGEGEGIQGERVEESKGGLERGRKGLRMRGMGKE